METITKTVSSLGVSPYEIHEHKSVHKCSPYTSYFGLFRDMAREKAWETFGKPSVQKYFSSGFEKFSLALEEFANLSKPASEQSDKELLFMLESLIQARQLLAGK